WPGLRGEQQARSFTHAWILVVSLTILVVPMVAPYNQIFLLPAAMLLTRYAPELWRRDRLTRFLLGLTALVALWPWMASLALMAASVFLPPKIVQSAWKLPFATTFVLPIFVFILMFQAFGWRSEKPS